ncbi:hypothetical protein ACFX15_008653 [Malus domestica]
MLEDRGTLCYLLMSLFTLNFLIASPLHLRLVGAAEDAATSPSTPTSSKSAVAIWLEFGRDGEKSKSNGSERFWGIGFRQLLAPPYVA